MNLSPATCLATHLQPSMAVLPLAPDCPVLPSDLTALSRHIHPAVTASSLPWWHLPRRPPNRGDGHSLQNCTFPGLIGSALRAEEQSWELPTSTSGKPGVRINQPQTASPHTHLPNNCLPPRSQRHLKWARRYKAKKRLWHTLLLHVSLESQP